MVLVVLGHALVGAKSAGGLSQPWLVLLVVIYSTHMALFFLLSGLLAARIQTRRWSDVLRTLGQRILWPYLLWSFLLLTIHFAMSAHTNVALAHYNPLSILWKPPSVMWFLYYLGGAMVLLRLLSPFSNVLIWGLAAILIAAAYAELVPQELRFVGLFLAAARCPVARLEQVLTPGILTLASLAAGITLLAAIRETGQNFSGYPAFGLPYLPMLVAGPILIFALSHLALAKSRADSRINAFILRVGQQTMPIFVVHILVTAGTRIVLLKLGVDQWGLIVCAATLLGVLIPMMAFSIAQRFRLDGVLGWR